MWFNFYLKKCVPEYTSAPLFTNFIFQAIRLNTQILTTKTINKYSNINIKSTKFLFYLRNSDKYYEIHPHYTVFSYINQSNMFIMLSHSMQSNNL